MGLDRKLFGDCTALFAEEQVSISVNDFVPNLPFVWETCILETDMLITAFSSEIRQTDTQAHTHT